jgi:hypothetical protein
MVQTMVSGMYSIAFDFRPCNDPSRGTDASLVTQTDPHLCGLSCASSITSFQRPKANSRVTDFAWLSAAAEVSDLSDVEENGVSVPAEDMCILQILTMKMSLSSHNTPSNLANMLVLPLSRVVNNQTPWQSLHSLRALFLHRWISSGFLFLDCEIDRQSDEALDSLLAFSRL